LVHGPKWFCVVHGPKWFCVVHGPKWFCVVHGPKWFCVVHAPKWFCVVHAPKWFCVVHGPKPPLHRHNLLSFAKFQDTERFLIPCPHHVSSRLPPSGETCKYAMVLSTQKKLGEILYLLTRSFLLCLSWLLRSRVRNFRRDL
jgi:hypothetical protein